MSIQFEDGIDEQDFSSFLAVIDGLRNAGTNTECMRSAGEIVVFNGSHETIQFTDKTVRDMQVEQRWYDRLCREEWLERRFDGLWGDSQ